MISVLTVVSLAFNTIYACLYKDVIPCHKGGILVCFHVSKVRTRGQRSEMLFDTVEPRGEIWKRASLEYGTEGEQKQSIPNGFLLCASPASVPS